MDLATHALVGLTLYQARKSRFPIYEPAIFWAALIGSEMPDFDLVYRLEGSAAYLLNHRGITHSIPGVLVMAGFFAYLIKLRYPLYSPHRLFYWTAVSGFVHVLLDAFNTWGTRVLYPFDKRWVTLDILPFLDIPLITLCVWSLLAGYRRPLHSRRIALLSMCLFTLYVGGRGLIHNYLLYEAQIQYSHAPIQKISILPTVNPLRWQAVVESRTAVVIGDISLLRPAIQTYAWYPISEDPLLTNAKNHWNVAQALPFFRYPALTVIREPGKSVITISDLYFGTNAQRSVTLRIRDDGSLISDPQELLIQ
jgi:inner membrane protein